MTRRDLLLCAAAASLAGCGTMSRQSKGSRPLVIAHRGASGERPEHTLAAYQLAIDQGADFIEPDLVMTRDGAFVCRHENEISETTDVAGRAEFAERRTIKSIDGRHVSGWFTDAGVDFRSVQRLGWGTLSFLYAGSAVLGGLIGWLFYRLTGYPVSR